MKFGIIGKSCTSKDKAAIKKVISSLPSECMIVTTGTKGGFNTYVKEEATKKSIPTMAFAKYKPPEGSWPREYEAATHRRNKKIVDECDTIYAFSSDEETEAIVELANDNDVSAIVIPVK